MSLNVDESGRRGRSRSPGGRRRAPDDEDRDRDRDRSRGPPMPPANVITAAPYPSDDRMGPSSPAYEYERLSSWRPPSPAADAYGGGGGYRSSREKVADPEDNARVTYGGGRREKDYRYEKERTSDRDRDSDRERERNRGKDRERRDRDRDRDRDRERDKSPAPPGLDSFKYLPQKYAPKIAAGGQPGDDPKYSRESLHERDSDRERRGKDRDFDRDRDRDRGKDRSSKRDYDDDLAYGKESGPKRESSSKYAYGEVKPWEYDKPDSSSVRYAPAARHDDDDDDARYGSRPAEAKKYHRDSYLGATADDPRRSSSSVVTVEPRRSAMKGGRERDASPQPPTARMSSLSVNTGGGHHGPSSSGVSLLSGAPASPLLESYHGTYQSMSPMPSPLLLPSHGGGHDVIPVSPIGSDAEGYGDGSSGGGGGGKKKSRRARFHDPVDDAARLAKALKGERRAPETEPLIEILPGLTHEQVMELRAEYKRLVKTGSERKGVNVAKHIRARLKDEDPSLMKACYAVALGRWESEAYWANFWYQGDKTRRELLIEALMGRTNDEVRAIKEGFADKKYGNSLTRCMKTELKEDKFKKAVLMVLDEQRMEETDAYGRPNRIDYDLVKDDVRELHHAVRSEKGGESLMISIVVQRSDTHLREVLRVYSETYRANFAKDALKKSGNLVVSTHLSLTVSLSPTHTHTYPPMHTTKNTLSLSFTYTHTHTPALYRANSWRTSSMASSTSRCATRC